MAKNKNSNGQLKGNKNQSVNFAPIPNQPNAIANSTAKTMRRRTKSEIKSTLLGTDPTRDYHSTRYSYFGELMVTNLPMWRLWTARMMLTSDPVVDFSFAIRNAALAAGEIIVESPNSRVREWVQQQWDYLWNHHRPKLLAHKKYGFAALQVLWKIRKEDGLLHIDGLKDFAPEDCRALEVSGNKLCGMKVKGKPVYNPQALWLKFASEFGNQYGVAITRKQYPCWYEKWMDHGAKRLQQLRMVKDAYIGDIFWYPPNLKVDLPSGESISWKDLLRETAEHRFSGGAMTLPMIYDTQGKELTKYTPPQNIGGATEIFNWVDYCDDGIFKGAGVPLETIEASETGSGYSGRSIPMIMLFSNCTEELVELVQLVDEQVIRPGAWLNFGNDPDYDIKALSLVESLSDDVGSGAMGGPIGGTAQPPEQPQQIPPSNKNVQFEELRAPKGGVTIHGVKYKGGEWIPNVVVQNLSEDDKSALLAGTYARQAKANPEQHRAAEKNEADRAKDELLIAAKNGDKAAMDKAFEQYGDLVYHLAHKFSKGKQGSNFDDLVSVGNIALLKSIDGYDPAKAKFVTYAWRAIQQDMMRHLHKGRKFNQVPEDDEGKQLEVEGTEDSPDAGMTKTQQLSKLQEALNTLNERDKEVVTRHIMGGERLQDIADTWGVSKMRVSQIATKALERLRAVLDEEQFSELVQDTMFEGSGESIDQFEEHTDQIKGGKADKKKPEDFDQDSLEEGIKVELEHTDDKTIAREIAMDHLTEDKEYYKNLKKVESTQHKEGPHKYCSTQFNLPPELAQMVIMMGLTIDPNDLASDGIEYEPHITALYGLHPEAEGMIVGPVTGMSPVAVQLGECSVFHADMSKPTEQGLHDVVKIEVKSEGLHNLHNELKKLPHTCTYPDYKPHITVAYVKPGMGVMYAERFNLLKGKVVVFDRLIFSNCERQKTSIPLQGPAQFDENMEGENSLPFKDGSPVTTVPFFWPFNQTNSS